MPSRTHRNLLLPRASRPEKEREGETGRPNARRRLIRTDPYRSKSKENLWSRAEWPGRWITGPEPEDLPAGWCFRCRCDVREETSIPIHVTADECYELFLDGDRIGRGPERGEPLHWRYETYELTLAPGEHVLTARVWAFGEELAPHGWTRVHPGFLLATSAPHRDRLATGRAQWEAKRLSGYQFDKNEIGWGTGPEITIIAAELDPETTRGDGDGWRSARVLGAGIDAGLAFSTGPAHHLVPATLPAMLERPVTGGRVRFVGKRIEDAIDVETHLADEEADWQGLLTGDPVRVPPRTSRRIIIDLEDYYCAYPALTVSAGEAGEIRLRWAEALFEPEDPTFQWPPKGHRDRIDGKRFVGFGDTFLPDGTDHQRLEPPLWRPGRYLELQVSTADQETVIEELELTETRYPLEPSARFDCDRPEEFDFLPICLRGLQMCAHDAYFDCPYYEQLMYVGDTRLQALTTFVLTEDDRLPRKAVRMFRDSLQPTGLTRSHFPGRTRQIIPSFSLWWIGMVHDFSRWRNDPAFVDAMMDGVRAVQNAWLSFLNEDGLIEGPRGWNFTDWVPDWQNGIPPEGESGVSAILNLHFLLALGWVEELEARFGEPEPAARAARHAGDLYPRIVDAFWDPDCDLFADTRSRDTFSEHANSLAILSGHLEPERLSSITAGLRDDPHLTRTTIYFSHYLFEAYAQCGLIDRLLERVDDWRALPDMGLRTTREMPEPTRSDCHGWGCHPIYHVFTSLLGIRPGPGFRTVEIRPQFGHLERLSGTLPHPDGPIEFDLHREAQTLTGHITLPAGILGTLRWREEKHELEGATTVNL